MNMLTSYQNSLPLCQEFLYQAISPAFPANVTARLMDAHEVAVPHATNLAQPQQSAHLSASVEQSTSLQTLWNFSFCLTHLPLNPPDLTPDPIDIRSAIFSHLFEYFSFSSCFTSHNPKNSSYKEELPVRKSPFKNYLPLSGRKHRGRSLVADGS